MFTQPEDLGIGVQVLSEVLCNDSKTGSLKGVVSVNSILVPNPDSTYRFQWNIPGERGQTVDSLGPGTYFVTVTNSKGCQSSASVGLSTPIKLEPVPTITQNTCSGVSNGAISIRVSGGVPFSGNRYFFKWASTSGDTVTTSTISNLAQGNYTVTITDSRKCVKEFSFPC